MPAIPARTPVARRGFPRRPSPAISRKLAAALSRFAGPAGVRARALAAAHPALAELAVTFPALLAALALPGDANRATHADALSLVIAGGPAREAARLLRLPLWLRRLPPESFRDRMPPLPATSSFACRIANVLPAANEAAIWLALVSLAYETCDEHFAIWVAGNAKNLTYRGCRPQAVAFNTGVRTLGLAAWVSRANGTHAHALLPRPWHPDMSVEAARETAHGWLERIEADVCLGEDVVACTWHDGARVGDLDFVPITTVAALAEEGAAMRHCVLSYSHAIATGICRVWSVRRDGARVATLEIRASGAAGRYPSIAQIQGPGNSDVEEDIWRAAYMWLAAQPRLACGAAVFDETLDCSRWRRLWKPYWRARGLVEWLPLTPTRHSLSSLARRV